LSHIIIEKTLKFEIFAKCQSVYKFHATVK